MFDQRLRISLFLILILGGCLWLGLSYGLVQHWLIKSQIDRLSGSDREMAESEFYAQGKSEHVFAGTLAKINHRGEGGVWVWTNQGSKYFQADKYTSYSYYDVCAARNNAGEGFEINDNSREITADIKQWATQAKVGDFVQGFLTTADNGTTVGNLREIYAYSQPLFLPLKLELICQD